MERREAAWRLRALDMHMACVRCWAGALAQKGRKEEKLCRSRGRLRTAMRLKSSSFCSSGDAASREAGVAAGGASGAVGTGSGTGAEAAGLGGAETSVPDDGGGETAAVLVAAVEEGVAAAGAVGVGSAVAGGGGEGLGASAGAGVGPPDAIGGSKVCTDDSHMHGNEL